MAVYPNSVRTFSTHVDLSENVFALHVNDLQDELVAVQTELGVTPKGTYPSVRTRLDGLTSGKSDVGHDHTNRLDNVAHDVPARHLYGSALGTPGNPTSWAVGTAAVVGTDPSPAHGDHQHAVPNQAAVIDMVIPAGVIWEYGGTALPPGNWVWCDGASYVRVAPYDKLFAAIGTRYGNVDGTHFNVPNLLGRFAMGGASIAAAVVAGGTRNAVVVAHGHAGSSVGGGSADHQHWVSHGHHIGGNGDHRHMDDLGFNYAFRIGGTQNDYMVPQTFNPRSAGITYTEHRYTGGHDHNTDSCDRGYSDGATNTGAYHGHGLTITGADGGVSGTDQNLPPYQTVNFVIKF